MLLIDAVHVFETAAFILLGVLVEIRQKSRDGLPSVHSQQLDLVAKTENKPISKVLARKAA